MRGAAMRISTTYALGNPVVGATRRIMAGLAGGGMWGRTGISSTSRFIPIRIFTRRWECPSDGGIGAMPTKIIILTSLIAPSRGKVFCQGSRSALVQGAAKYTGLGTSHNAHQLQIFGVKHSRPARAKLFSPRKLMA